MKICQAFIYENLFIICINFSLFLVFSNIIFLLIVWEFHTMCPYDIPVLEFPGPAPIPVFFPSPPPPSLFSFLLTPLLLYLPLSDLMHLG